MESILEIGSIFYGKEELKMKILKEIILAIIFNVVFWGIPIGGMWLAEYHAKILMGIFLVVMYFFGKEIVRDVKEYFYEE